MLINRYASTENVKQAKEMGVRDVAFHKKRGIAIEDMVKSKWVYKKLRNFRAGVEANISVLKRTYGMADVCGKAGSILSLISGQRLFLII